MIKLINVRAEVEKDVQFGTCEFCYHTADLHTSFLIFQDDTGQTEEIETGYWSWGDYIYLYEVDNIPDFSAFVREKGRHLNFLDFGQEEYQQDSGFQEWFHDVYNEYKTNVE